MQCQTFVVSRRCSFDAEYIVGVIHKCDCVFPEGIDPTKVYCCELHAELWTNTPPLSSRCKGCQERTVSYTEPVRI